MLLKEFLLLLADYDPETPIIAWVRNTSDHLEIASVEQEPYTEAPICIILS